MSKLAAVLVPTFAILVISVAWLPSSFDQILNWFGPSLGSPFLLLLGLVFFAFGNPLAYAAVFTGWAITGVLVGVFARGLRSAISAASLVFTLTYAMLGASFGAVFFSLDRSGILKGNLPPVPPGTTTASLLNIPIFKQFAPLFLSGVSGAGSVLGSFNVSSFVEGILPSLIGGFVILVVFAAITGFAFGRVVKMLKPGRKVDTRSAAKESETASAPQQVPVIAKAIAVMLIIILGTSVAMFSSSGRAYSLNNYYSESALVLTNPDGSVSNYYSYMNSQFQFGSLSADSVGSDLVLGVVASEIGSLNFLPQSISSSLSQYVSLVPPTLVVLVYNATCSSSGSEAGSTSQEYASSFGIADLTALMSRQVIIDQDYQNGCAYVYQSQEPISEMALAFVKSVVPAISDGGLSTVFESGLTDGFLVPGATTSSVNSSAIFAGYISTSVLPEIPVIGQVLSPGAPRGILGVVGGIAEQDSVLHSSSDQHVASFSALTDYSGKIEFSNNTQFSLAGIGVPLQGDNVSTVPNLSNYNFTVIASNPSLAVEVVGEGQTIMNLNPGNSVTDSTLQAVFTKLLPAYLSIHKTLTANSDGTLTVIISVANKDSDSLSNLVMNDTAFTDAYSSSLSLVSGESLDAHVSVLAPSAVVTYTYTVRPTGIGTYSSYPAILTYDLNGTRFTAFSNAAYYNATAPGGLSAVGILASSLGTLAAGGGNPSAAIGALFISVFVALLGLAGYMEFRAFRKWRAG